MTLFVAEQILEKKTELTQELTTTNKDNLSLKNELESLKTQIHSSDATLSVELEKVEIRSSGLTPSIRLERSL